MGQYKWNGFTNSLLYRCLYLQWYHSVGCILSPFFAISDLFRPAILECFECVASASQTSLAQTQPPCHSTERGQIYLCFEHRGKIE